MQYLRLFTSWDKFFAERCAKDVSSFNKFDNCINKTLKELVC